MPDLEKMKAEALDYYDRGFPSLLPEENRWKRLVQNHRWGYHQMPKKGCPVCERGSASEASRIQPIHLHGMSQTSSAPTQRKED